MRRIAVLACGAFVVASDGTLVIGLLRQIAGSLHISASLAGQAVTVFAVVYALVGPGLVRLLRRARPERVLVGVLGVFAVGNAMTALAPSFVFLLGARVLAAACAGVFMPMAALVAARTVAPERQARALSVVVGGSSAATAIGVPLGTFIGGAVGWRTVFFAIAALTAIIVIGLWLALEPQEGVMRARPAPERRAEVLLTLLTTVMWAAGSFTFFTYIALVVRVTAAVGTNGLALYLLLFGLAGIAGAVISGWLTDTKGPFVALGFALATVAAALTALGSIAAFGSGHGAALTAVAIGAYGVGTWAVTPPQQKRLVGHSEGGFLLSLNASALYAGVALGSALGGALLSATNSVASLCFVAAILEIVALVIARLSHVMPAQHRT